MGDLQIKEIILEKDIVVYRLRATGFPEGVGAAHMKLHSLIELDLKRQYFGISHPENNGAIAYWAAATEINPEELSRHGLEKFIIEAGVYKYIDVHLFMENISDIGNAFKILTSMPDVKQDGYCLEWYIGKDCRCMIGTQQTNAK